MGLVSAIVIGVVATIMIIQSGLDENIAILEAGLSDIPIIKNDDLQELGRLYSELNDRFEREIDELVTGKANRNNKANQTLNHYGVYGQDNINVLSNTHPKFATLLFSVYLPVLINLYVRIFHCI